MKNEPFVRVDMARRFIHGFLGFESDESQHREQKCRVVGNPFARREEPRKKDEIAAALLWNVKKSMSSWEPECAGSTKPGLGWSPTS